MTKTYKNDLVVRAARGEETPRTPLWLMRQAGRSDPEYNRVKGEAGLPLEAMFRNPNLAARISLLPKRFGVDAIIFYQDILTPLSPMGADFVFRPGPVLESPIRTSRQIDTLQHYDVAEELPFVGETFRLIHEELDGELPVLGFAGAPLTLAAFMIEGKSFGDSIPETTKLLETEPAVMHALLEKLTEVMTEYLKYQIEVGAAALQLFESVAYLLSPTVYNEFALPYQKRIFEALKGKIPTINFAREWPDLSSLDAAGADIISLPKSISVSEARAQLGEDRVFQGNLDKHILANGTLDEIEEAAKACVASGEHRGHIFNLDHGLLRTTPFENILHLIEVVRNAGAEESP